MTIMSIIFAGNVIVCLTRQHASNGTGSTIPFDNDAILSGSPFPLRLINFYFPFFGRNCSNFRLLWQNIVCLITAFMIMTFKRFCIFDLLRDFFFLFSLFLSSFWWLTSKHTSSWQIQCDVVSSAFCVRCLFSGYFRFHRIIDTTMLGISSNKNRH